MTIILVLLGIAAVGMGLLGLACLLLPRPDDFPDLEHVPPHLRNAFIGDRRAR